MAKGTNIRAGGAYVELFAEARALQRGLRQASAEIKKFADTAAAIGASIAAAGSALVAPMALATRTYAKFGDEVAKAAKRAGLSAQVYSELAHAAEMSGAAGTDVSVAMRTLSQRLYQAERGATAVQQAFELLGTSSAELLSMTPEARFERIAAAVATVQDPALRTALAMEVFGRSADRLMPMIESGPAGLAAMRAEAREFGIAISDESAAGAEELTDALTVLSRSIRGVQVEIGNALGPTVVEFATGLAHLAAEAGRWISDNRELVLTIAGVGAALMSTGTAVVAFAVTAKAALMGLSVSIAFVTGAFKVLSVTMALVSSPLLLLAAGATTAIAAWAAFSGYFGEVATWLGERLSGLIESTKGFVGDIAGALKAGDIQAAVDVMWTGLQNAWYQGLGVLRTAWENIWAGLQTYAIKVIKAVMKGWAWVEWKGRQATSWLTDTAQVVAIDARYDYAIAKEGRRSDISKEEKEANKRRLNEMRDQEHANLWANSRKTADQIYAEYAQNLDIADQAADVWQQGVNERFSNAMTSIGNMIAGASARFLAARQKAREAAQKGEQADDSAVPAAPGAVTPSPLDLLAARYGDRVQRAATSAVGTASGWGAGLLGRAGTSQTLESKVDKSNDLLQRILDEVKAGGSFAI